MRRLFAILFSIFLILIPTQTKADPLSDITCLARVMYYEASGESTEGVKAVGYVIINRTLSPTWGSSICDVVSERGQFARGKRINDQIEYKRIYSIAKTVYLNPYNDNTRGSTYFHNTRVNPDWRYSKVKTRVIGSHVFYRSK